MSAGCRYRSSLSPLENDENIVSIVLSIEISSIVTILKIVLLYKGAARGCNFRAWLYLSKVLLILRCKLVLQGDRPANIVIKISIQLLVKYVWNINDRNELWCIHEEYLCFGELNMVFQFFGISKTEICKLPECEDSKGLLYLKYFLSRRWRIEETVHAMLKVDQGM